MKVVKVYKLQTLLTEVYIRIHKQLFVLKSNWPSTTINQNFRFI